LEYQKKLINHFHDKACSAKIVNSNFVNSNMPQIKEAILIREVENVFLRLFSQGRLNGTVHTCVGQEFTGVAVAKYLSENDWVTSNHRCHGHFIAKTGNWKGLIDELIGTSDGICHGIGSSQHLFEQGFMSNGVQGSLLPVASGIALAELKNKTDAIVISFIGEGTLGEGIVYEVFNLSSILKLPHVIVCENNLYSQSTPQSHSVSGSILKRAEAFGWSCYNTNTWDLKGLFNTVKSTIDSVRKNHCPAFINIETYRLNAHSKGDDNRPIKEVDTFKSLDPLNRLIEEYNFNDLQKEIAKEVNDYADDQIQQSKKVFRFSTYRQDQLPRRVSNRKNQINNLKMSMLKALNIAYKKRVIEGAIMIGEDMEDPYGGTFKVTKGIHKEFPDRVISTPISEAAITGLGIGLSVSGIPAYVEIMFGDFITNATDQIINNACKFFHMYGHKLSSKLRIRAAMGGRRGYGPTHSQSLEKVYLGIENLAVFAISSLVNPEPLIDFIDSIPGPALIVENKADYGTQLWSGLPGLNTSITGGSSGTVVVKPKGQQAEITIITYGASGRWIADNYEKIFIKSDVIFEIYSFQQIHPIPISHVERTTMKTRAVLVVEEGIEDFGWASEVIFQLGKRVEGLISDRVGSLPVSIPSVRSLEDEVLPSVDRVSKKLIEIFEKSYE